MAAVGSVDEDGKPLVVRKVTNFRVKGKRSIQKGSYFHGYIPQKMAEKMLKQDGDFLVRQALMTTVLRAKLKGRYIISVKINPLNVKNNTNPVEPSVINKFYNKAYTYMFGENTASNKETKDQIKSSYVMQNDGTVEQANQNPIGTKLNDKPVTEADLSLPCQKCRLRDHGSVTCNFERNQNSNVKDTDVNEDYSKNVKHLVIRYCNSAKLYHIDTEGFSEVADLVEYYRILKKPIQNNIVLTNPIEKAPWQLAREQIDNGVHSLGDSGMLGTFFAGHVRKEGLRNVMVAIKVMPSHMTEEELESLYEEVSIMQKLVHVNILGFHGIVCNFSQPLLIMEFAEARSVKEMVENYPVPSALKERFVLGASRGLQYIHSQNIIHQFITARNVFLGKGYEAKIAGFELAIVEVKDTKKNADIDVRNMPERHMPIESLSITPIFNSKTDVWSFGVYMWEVFNYASQPYGMIHSTEDIKSYLQSGERLKRGDQFPDYLWTLTTSCWQESPNQRPSMEEAVKYIEANCDKSAFLLWQYLDESLVPIEDKHDHNNDVVHET